MHLLEAAPSLLTDVLQTGGMLGVLAFFLMYFMREQKEVRAKMDGLSVKYEADLKELRKSYDDKVEMLVRRFDEINGKSLQALNDVRASNDRLTDAVNSLTEKLLP